MTDEITMTVSDMTVLLADAANSTSGGSESSSSADYISDECEGRSVVDCWGDGIFYGYGEDTNAPTLLSTLLGNAYTVNNYGQYGETAEAVAFRQGAIYAAVEPFTVSSGVNDATQISYSAPDGDDLSTMSNDGDYLGDDHVYIGGEEFIFRKTYNGSGKIYATSTDQVGMEFKSENYMFAEGGGVNHTIIICVGKSGWAGDDPATLVEIIKSMVRHNGNNNYIVVGTPDGSATSMAATERALGAAFGKRFFNARKFISAYGLSENSLTATDDDTAAITNGEIPPSLLNDEGYGNAYFHTALAHGIYRLGKVLGLWD